MIKAIPAIIILFMTFTNPSTEPITVDNYQVIPDEAIRLRILAESDEDDDQVMKRKVRDQVNAQITDWVKEIDNIEQARNLIQQNIDQIEAVVANTIKQFDSELSYQVEYNKNVSFPAKLYDTYVYPAGEYEAILITLGSGQGSNWWCVLFPPLCFLDFSAGATVEDHNDEESENEEQPVKVSFFFFEWFK
ncbi:stage II sporulation protein R [Amphibacillus marinus]|uniref:Stage II sporulation protein R n=1 Tax=Amphibacillus marinus TaxID=872970 RepID=A0A1H8N0P1_9BACI|nr:stage II sporulation protein R [Amphibacillus marinus]SEO23076.1 stage II sporulation protein R [Amphibacillus marinus]